MAMSTMFDEWYDDALVFSTVQLKSYDPRVGAVARSNALIERLPAVIRRRDFGELPVWWQEVAQRQVATAKNYLFRITAPALDVKALYSLVDRKVIGDAAYKQLTLDARKLSEDAQSFVDAWWSDVYTAMQTHVSMGRKCVMLKSVSGWKKAEASLSNKVAYAMFKEMEQIEKAKETLHAFTSRGAGNG